MTNLAKRARLLSIDVWQKARLKAHHLIAGFLAWTTRERATRFAAGGMAVLALAWWLSAVRGWPGLQTSFAIAEFLSACALMMLAYPPSRTQPLWWLFLLAWAGAGFSSWAGFASGSEVWGSLGFLLLILYVGQALIFESSAIRSKIAISFRGLAIAIAAILGAVALLSVRSTFGDPQIYVPWPALQELSHGLVVVQQSTPLVGQFDIFVRLLPTCCGVATRWRIDTYFEVLLAFGAAFWSARVLMLPRAASAAAAAMFALGSWPLALIEAALFPMWTAPILLVLALRPKVRPWPEGLALVALAIASPYCWPLLLTLAGLRAFQRRHEAGRGVTDYTLLVMAAAVGLAFQIFWMGLGAVDRPLMYPSTGALLLLAGLAAYAAALGLQRRLLTAALCCVLLCVPLAAAAFLNGDPGLLMHALFPGHAVTMLLATAWFACAAAIIASIQMLWTSRMRATILIIVAASIAATASIPAPRGEVRINQSSAYQRLRGCPTGNVSDFPVPAGGSILADVYAASALNVGQRPIELDPVLRGTVPTSEALDTLVKSNHLKYVIVHFDDASVDQSGDVLGIPQTASFAHLRLLDASPSGTWLYSTINC